MHNHLHMYGFSYSVLSCMDVNVLVVLILGKILSRYLQNIEGSCCVAFSGVQASLECT